MCSKILAINIGNTNITCGLYKDKKLIFVQHIPTKTKDFKNYNIFGRKDIKYTVISSVVPSVTKTLKKNIKTRILEIKNSDVHIKNLYKKKSEVGIDRLLASYSAREKYGPPLIIIDFGTATTFNVVNKKGEFAGGVILPGIKMWGNFLYENTDKLPKIKFKKVNNLIGKSTKDCIQIGAFYGNIEMIKGLMNKIKRVIGNNSKVIATGGAANLMAPYINGINIINLNLILDGMVLVMGRYIWGRK
ncbi:MAG: type III pantothenate kinase [Candidatus Firestonebacteria bacterium]